MIIRLTVFVLGLCFACLLAWAGGYNFDRRDSEVMWWVFYSVICAGFLSAYPGLGDK